MEEIKNEIDVMDNNDVELTSELMEYDTDCGNNSNSSHTALGVLAGALVGAAGCYAVGKIKKFIKNRKAQKLAEDSIDVEVTEKEVENQPVEESK